MDITRREVRDQDNLRVHQLFTILSEMIRISMLPVPLQEQLDAVLKTVISTSSSISLESKGAIFLVDDYAEALVMEASYGLNDHVRLGCAQVPFGECLCGRAAVSGTIEFADSIDNRHERRFQDMTDHGHYCVPIRSRGKTVGVMALYVSAGHGYEEAEEEFLQTVSEVLAGIIVRRRAEETLRQAHDELETRVAERTAELARANEELQIEIAERKEAEALLRYSEEKFRNFVEHSRDGIVLVDEQGVIVEWSHGEELITGIERTEAAGRPIWDVQFQLALEERRTPAVYEAIKALVLRLLSGLDGTQLERLGQSTEHEIRSRDGKLKIVQTLVSPIKTQKGFMLGSISRDMTTRKRTEQELKESLDKLHRTLESTIRAMALTVEARDPYTAGHQRRVAELACAIAREMGVAEERIEVIRLAASVHDIGKIYVPAEILSKPGHLNDLEFGLIKIHPQSAHDILQTIELPWPIAEIVVQHHERLDGSGYPRGLEGENILLEARIIAVADVVEAMASHRPYRPSRGISKALEEISQHRGAHFDPAAVDACVRLFSERNFQFEDEPGEDTYL